MEHILKCDCGQDIPVATSQAGEQIRCAACGQTVNVPKLRELRSLPIRQDEGQSAELRRQGANPWRTWRGPVMAVVTCIFIVSATMTSWFGLQRYRLDLSYTPDSEVKNGDARIDSLDLRKLDFEWREYSTEGLGQRRTPPFVLLQLYGNERARLAQIAGSVAGVSFLGMLIVLGSAGAYKRKANP